MATMERDAEAAIDSGADGVVFGVLERDGKIDVMRTKRMRHLIGKRQAVFHRAFDVTPDPFKGLEQLVDLGITRILTSGQRDTVPEGVELIAELVERAGKRIEILPGSGIRPFNVREIVDRTGCRQVHLTAWSTVRDSSTQARPEVTFGGALHPPEDRYEMTDAKLVREIGKRLRG
jgi:copper homeostasis protein